MTSTTSSTSPAAIRRRRRRRTTDTTQQRITLVLTVLAALAAGATAPSPTGTAILDAAICASAAAIITLAAANSRRWTWVWLGAVALAGAIGSGPWVVAAAVALGAAVIGIFEKQTHPALGAFVGAVAGVTLLHLDTDLPDRVPTLLALLAVAPPLASAYRLSKRRHRRLINRIALGVAAFVLIAGAGFALGALQARAALDDAVTTSQDALEALRSGEQERAGQLFAQAEAEFADAGSALTAPWALPARIVPVAGHQAAAATVVAEQGEALAASASETATTAPYATLRAVDGGVDLAVVRSFQEPVAAAAAQLDASLGELQSVQSDWLLPQLAEPLDDFIGEIEETLPDAEMASSTLDALPSILGGEGPRRYFVAFANPAEARFQGGFTASYAELLADNGKVTLERSGPIRDLIDADGSEGRTLGDLRVYDERYSRWSVTRFFQNVTASPDWGVNAEVIGQLYPQAGGSEIDGAIYVDPAGLAALLELTGPVQVPELGRTLDAAGVEEFLTKGQYTDPAILEDPDRQTALVGAGDAMFDSLLSEELPTPRVIGEVLAPAVEQGHLLFTSFDPDDDEFLGELGSTGAFVDREGTDWLSVRSSNGAANKLNAYTSRDVAYDVTIDPEAQSLEATLTVTIRNDAPIGLPAYVSGNQRGLPEATDVHHLAVFTPHAIVSATRDGQPVAVESQREYGGQVYSSNLVIPAGSETTLVYRFEGSLRDPDTYRFVYDHQALLTPDALRIGVRSAGAGTSVTSADMETTGDEVSLVTDASVDRAVEATITRD